MGEKGMDENPDWKRVRDDLVGTLRMRTNPVGVRLLKGSEIASLSDARVLSATAVCQMIAISRYGRTDGVVVTKVKDQRCLWASACLGMMRSPDRLTCGDMNRAFVKDSAAGEELQRMVFAIGNDSRDYNGVLTAPLDLFPGKPDVIVLYLTAGQALKVLLGLSYDRGEVIENPITGQAAVCQSIARAVTTGKVTMEIPCFGDRTYGLVQDDELVIVVPVSKVAQVLEGMKGTDAFAPYPFKPFLVWPVLFPPGFEPTQSELDQE